MNTHGIKCRIGLHDWKYDEVEYDGIVVFEKSCQWCDAKEIAEPVIK